jgi:hypothetical protein
MHKICFTVSLFHAFTCFERYVLIVRRSNLYFTASGIVKLKKNEWYKVTKINSFINFSYFSNFRPLTCFSVMIPDAV